jgi:hypothetical protein
MRAIVGKKVDLKRKMIMTKMKHLTLGKEIEVTKMIVEVLEGKMMWRYV